MNENKNIFSYYFLLLIPRFLTTVFNCVYNIEYEHRKLNIYSIVNGNHMTLKKNILHGAQNKKN